MKDKQLPKPINLHVPISKIDEEARTVWGYATVEELDKHGEIVGYEASKKAFAAWPGNIREMHGDKAVGKSIEVKFDDANKGVWLGAYVSTSADGENAWTKVKEGVLQGFSIGGSINDFQMVKVDDKDTLKVTDYQLNEVSLVDNPAVPSAMFQMVKSTKSGRLVHKEKMFEKGQFKAPWWMQKYYYSPGQKVMKATEVDYNKKSMGAKSEVTKNIWSAGSLVDLGRQLSDFIYMADWDEKDTVKLKGALEQIKEAAAAELTEEEHWPSDLKESIELAMTTLNLSKKDLEDKMSKPAANKATIGQPERDAEANEVASAEQTGRPLNDTKERAQANDLPEAGAATTETVDKPVLDEDGNEVTDKKGKPKVETEEVDTTQGLEYHPDAPQGEGDSNYANEEAKRKAEEGTAAVAAADDENEDEGEEAPDKPKKAAGADDLQKSTENDLAKSILSGVEAMIKPLSDRLSKLEGQPVPGKAKPSFAIEKGAEVEEQESEHKARFDQLLKRADELAKDPSAGTPAERMAVALEMRKLARLMDPISVAKHAAIRAQFQTPQNLNK